MSPASTVEGRRSRGSWLLAGGLAALVQVAASPARAAPTPEPRQQAQELVDNAFAEHAAGRDIVAVGLYLKAYELSKATPILFNVATIYDRHLHERALAMEYFRRYIESPDAAPEFVQKATDRITALKQELELDEEAAKRNAELSAQLAPAPAPAPAPAERTGWSGLRIGGIVLAGAGVAGIATSLALGAVAKAKIDSANMVCGPATCWAKGGVTLEQQAVSFATGSTVAFVAGAVLLAAGVTIAIAAPSRSSRSASALITMAPQVGANGGGVALYMGF